MSQRPFIEFKKISKNYFSNDVPTTVLKNFSLEVHKGEIFGIIGQSGAGKSTLMRCLLGLEKVDQGEILIDGLDISALEEKELRKVRKKIGMIFQHFHLLNSRNVFENIAYPLEISGIEKEIIEKRVVDLLELVGLSEKRYHYPSMLSGGQKQRVGIARALAEDPDILLCDEATSALDPAITRSILDLLRKIHKKLNLTILLITHEMEVVKQICQKVAVLDRGNLIEHGKVEHIFADPEHEITKKLLQNVCHEIPKYFFSGGDKTLLRLCFKGKAASQPIISLMIRKFDVDANILLGWIDSLQNVIVGNLIIELTGSPEKIAEAIAFLEENTIHIEHVTS